MVWPVSRELCSIEPYRPWSSIQFLSPQGISIVFLLDIVSFCVSVAIVVFLDFLDSHIGTFYPLSVTCPLGPVVRISGTVIVEVGSSSVEGAAVLAIRCNFWCWCAHGKKGGGARKTLETLTNAP